jgi:hypothetical protein
MGRPTNNRRQKSPNVTLIGEGITEQYYFKHIRTLYNYQYSLRPYFFGITSLTDMSRKIDEVIEGGGIAICVFDTDVSQRVKAEERKLNSLFKKYRRMDNVVFCDSLPSVEYWFLLHHKNTNRHFKDSTEVERELKKVIPEYEKTTNYLEKVKWVADLCSDSKLENAIQRSKDFDENSPSYSKIYKAFEIFRK